MNVPNTSPVEQAAAAVEQRVKNLGKRRLKKSLQSIGLLAAGGTGLSLTSVAPLALLLVPSFLFNGKQAWKQYQEAKRGMVLDRVADRVLVREDGIFCQVDYSPFFPIYSPQRLIENPQKYLSDQILAHVEALGILNRRQIPTQAALVEQLELERIIEEAVPPKDERGPVSHVLDALGQIPLYFLTGHSRKTHLGRMIEDGNVEVAQYELLRTAFAYGTDFFTLAEAASAVSFSSGLQDYQLQRCQTMARELGYAARRLRDTHQNLVRSFERRYQHLVGVPYSKSQEYWNF